MGFWDFLKKSKQVEKEKVSFANLESWMKDQKKESEKQEQLFTSEIKDKLLQLTEELQKEILILKNINVDKRKAEDKVKLVVKENLSKYIYSLEKLEENFKELYKQEKGNPTEKIRSIFSDFEKKSGLSFEKATFLIGEELGNVRESLNNFLRSLKRILEENKGTIEKLKAIYITETKIKKLFEMKESELEVKKNIEEHEEKVSNLAYSIKTKEGEIEKIKASEKFLAETKKRELLNTKKEELEKEISNLRGMVDFKALTNFYHIFEKEMALIKQYREDFRNTFNKTKGQDLLDLLKEAKLETAEITGKIEKIEEKQREIEAIVPEKTGIEDKEKEIKEALLKIDSLNEEKASEEKRIRKILESSEEIKKEIKQEMEKINVEVDY